MTPNLGCSWFGPVSLRMDRSALRVNSLTCQKFFAVVSEVLDTFKKFLASTEPDESMRKIISVSIVIVEIRSNCLPDDDVVHVRLNSGFSVVVGASFDVEFASGFNLCTTV